MITIKNVLPGARKSVPYIPETSEYVMMTLECNLNHPHASFTILEDDRTQQGEDACVEWIVRM